MSYVLFFADFHARNNAVGSNRVLSLHWKEVHFETGFSLAVFSKTTKVEIAEQGLISRAE